MPAPAMGRGWSQAALGVTAAGEWLRNLLRRTVGSIRIATHTHTQLESDFVGMEFKSWP